jgi:hypothetical protein
MIQRRSGPRPTAEAAQRIEVAGEFVSQKLKRDKTL